MNYKKEERRIYHTYMLLDANALSLTMGNITLENLTQKLIKAYS